MAVRNSPTRQDTWVVRVKLNGNTLGIWDKKTGGALDSGDTKYYPGAMTEAVSLGGVVTTDNITLQRLYDRHDDHDVINTLLNAVGKGSVSVHQRPMDLDGHEYGKSITYNGKLKRVMVPDVDSESSSAALVEIEVSVAGRPNAI